MSPQSVGSMMDWTLAPDIREKFPGRANRSPLFWRFLPKRLFNPNIDLHMKLILSTNFVRKSAAPAANDQQENYKLMIRSANL